MKAFILSIAAFFLAANTTFSKEIPSKDYRILSPDGMTYLNVRLADGKLTYSAGYRTLVNAKKKNAVPDTLDVPMLLDSPLGLYTNLVDFSKDLTFVQEERPEGDTYKQSYRLRQGKQSEINGEDVRHAVHLGTVRYCAVGGHALECASGHQQAVRRFRSGEARLEG